MPDTSIPGVFVEESATPPPISGVSTATAGFVGVTERGPEFACLVTSWLEYQRLYGGSNPRQSFLADAVNGFFINGGQRCYVTRIVPGAARAASASLGGLIVRAIGRGLWGQNIFVKLEPSSLLIDGETRYKITIWYYRAPVPRGNPDPTAPEASPSRRKPEALEQFDNLSDEQGADNYLLDVLNSSSNLVRVAWDAPRRPALPANRLTVRLRRAASGGSLKLADFIGDLDPIGGLAGELLGRGRGLKALEAIDEIALLCMPDEVHPALEAMRTPLREAILNQCETRRDRFAILSVEAGRSAIDHPLLEPPGDSSYAALYYPWIEVMDPETQKRRLVPATGHLAGIYARTDLERGVHKPPANEVVRGALNLEFPVTQAMQETLNPRNVNCLRDFRPDPRGIRVWGARSMSADPEWRYVNIRRLFIYMEKSLALGTRWVVFEPNDEPLWARVRQSVTAFLFDLWRNGALLGATPDQAFFVRCDRSTMTQDDIDNGRLVCLIGVAAVRPAEFVIFRIGQKTADAPD